MKWPLFDKSADKKRILLAFCYIGMLAMMMCGALLYKASLIFINSVISMRNFAD